MANFEGGCACGQLRYSIDAEPIMAGHCQCRKCQQLTGTGHASFAAFPADSVAISGEARFWSYTADSGNQSSRGHCTTCGAAVLGKTSGMPGMLAITLGSLDDPSKVVPQLLVFAESGLSWDHVDTAIPRFARMPPG